MADVEVALVILTDRRGRIVMQHRTDDAPTDPGLWTVPGGMIEPGEDPEVAVHRELLEETGLRCPTLSLERVIERRFHGRPVRYHVFTGTTDATDDDIVLGEGQAMVFVARDEVGRKDLSPIAREVLTDRLHAPDGAGSAVAAVARQLTEEIPRLLAEQDLPGMAVGICDRSGIRWSAGFGVRARGGREPVSSQTVFSIQSGSKMYTATAVMLAVQRGLVDLDTPITAYLPDFTVHSRWESEPQQRMTLRHLLSHTAGFTHEAPLGSNFDDRDTSFEEHCRSISATWLRFPVGHHYEYSNLGIDLAALIVQQVTGVAFHEFVRTEILRPLGLLRTSLDHGVIARDPDRAVGHSTVGSRIPVRVPMVGAGGAYTNVVDALRYLHFHLTGGRGVLRPELLDQMYQIPNPLPGQRFGYGLGVSVSRWNGRRVLNHGGSGFGFQSDMAWDPDAGIGVVMLTNTDQPLKTRLAMGMVADLTGSDPYVPPPPPAATGVDREALAMMAGEYVGRGFSVVRIGVDGDRVSLERGGARQPLRVIGADELVAEDDGYQRFRLLGHDGGPGHDYLVSADDGSTYYRNDAPSLGDDALVTSYGIDYMGTRIGRLQLRRSGVDATLIGDGDEFGFPPLRLTEHATGLYFCAMGEALDLTGERPTYANIALHPEGPS
ncbi:serine hydrolase [Actinopolymorpha sp. NPDC004070]|uniref:serine hydrolase n=1 Tax=Actinopolymorpha sp. NPDC004070 TaxID=3154548 RepID=UPI0033B03C33